MKEERGFKILRVLKFFLQILFFLIPFLLYPAVELYEIQDFDPSVFYETTAIKDDAKLIYYKDKTLFYKDIFKKSAKWKKLQNFYPEDFFMKIERDKKVNLIPIENVTGLFFLKNKRLCSFTTGLGTTPNTTIIVIDKNKNKVIFTPVLIEKKEKQRGKYIFVEKTYFNPVISDDEQYLVTDGFDGAGERVSSLFDLNKKVLLKEFKDCAFPFIYKNKIYFMKDDKKLKSHFLTSYDMKTFREMRLDEIKGRIVGIKIIKDKGFVINDKNIYLFDINNPDKCKILLDFGDYAKGYQIFSVEQIYTTFDKDNPYLLIVVKRMKNDRYEWKLYCHKIQDKYDLFIK